jgi:hypothetical protein
MNGPFIELGFYFAALSGHEALAKTFRHLLSCGGKCNGTVWIVRGYEIQAKPNSHRSLLPPSLETVVNPTEIETLLADPNCRVLDIDMRPPDYFGSSRELRLAQLTIDETSVEKDNNPVAIWLDGSAINLSTETIKPKKAKLGREVLGAFKRLAASLAPDYAAITVEYGLDCPSDLRNDPNTYAFHNFYVSEKFLGQSALESIRLKFPKAIHEQLSEGQLTVTSSWLYSSNYRKVRELDDSNALCAYVASLIAQKAKPSVSRKRR